MTPEEPPRLPLREHVSRFADGVMSDGSVALMPDDPGYERAYRIAVDGFLNFDCPMPYASQGLIERTLAARAQAAGAREPVDAR